MISYVEIRLLDIDKEEFVSDRRISNLITLVHRAAKGRKFAVSFPQYSIGKVRKLGSILRIFSFDDVEALKFILNDGRLSMFLLDYCQVMPIKLLSEFQIKGWVRYCKSNIAKKRGPSHERRAEKRLQIGKRKTPFIKTSASEIAGSLPRFSHYSLSSDMEAPLFIKKEIAKGSEEIKFDSFGFSLAGGRGTPLLEDEK